MCFDVRSPQSNPGSPGHHSSVMTAVRFTGQDLCGMLSPFDLALSQMQREREGAGISICILSWRSREEGRERERAYRRHRVQ